MPTRAALAIAHLEVRLRPLNRALRAAVARQAAVAARLDRPDLTPYCITDEQVGQLLDHVEPLLGEPAAPGPAGLPVTEAERAAEAALRGHRRSRRRAARAPPTARPRGPAAPARAAAGPRHGPDRAAPGAASGARRRRLPAGVRR